RARGHRPLRHHGGTGRSPGAECAGPAHAAGPRVPRRLRVVAVGPARGAARARGGDRPPQGGRPRRAGVLALSVPSASLPVLEVDLGPGVRAFFTTREGGVSAGEHAALNLGLAVEDEPRRVLANHDLLARELGVPVAFGRQVHGADVLDVTGPPRPGRPTVGTGDALVSVRAGVALGVVVADCVPVLLADGERGVVATVHAGRAGLVAGV